MSCRIPRVRVPVPPQPLFIELLSFMRHTPREWYSALKRLVSTVQFCPSAPFLTFHYRLITNRPERSCERMGSGSLPLGKSREVECGDGHGRRNIKRFYVAAEGDGESSGGLPADLS